MPVTVPTLSENGWVTDSQAMTEYLFTYFLLSEYSQTQLYLGSISSFPWILQKYKGNTMELTSALTSALNTYYRRHFPNVDIEVTEKTIDSESSKAEITIYVKVIDSLGDEFILGRILSIKDSKLNAIIKLSNTGSPA